MEKQILSTKDYSKFKRLTGNRVVNPLRVKRIIQSIVNVGYITNPIIVNENMEIIDGQGRFEALKNLYMPIDYIVVNGTGINECQSMNVFNSNWKDIDYIHSYAEIGNESYQRLLFCTEYGNYGLLVASVALKSLARVTHNIIQSGVFVATESEFEEAKKRLAYLDRFQDIINKTDCGNKSILRQIIIFCYTMKGVDNERLFNKLSDNIHLLQTYSNLESCAYAVELIYNRNAKEYVYITTEFKKMMRENGRNRNKTYREIQKIRRAMEEKYE